MNNYFLTMLVKVAVLTAMAIPGFVLRKAKLIPEETSKGISNILVYVAIPFLVLTGFQDCEYSIEILSGIIFSAVIATLSHLVMLLISKLAFRENLGDNRVARFASVFGNCGFFGYPIIRLLFPDVPVAMIYAVVYNAVFSFISYTIGIATLTGDKKSIKPLKALTTPATIALVVAFLLFFFNIKIATYAPTVDYAMSLLADFSTPLAMILTGIKLAELNVKKYLKNVLVYAVTVLKLLVAPVFTLLVSLILATFFEIDKTVVLTMTVLASTPTATSTIAMAESYNQNSEIASVFSIWTAIISVVTVPLFAFIVNVI